MVLSCPSILVILFSLFLVLSVILTPKLTSTLPTEMECLDEPNSTFKRCAYCWVKPSHLHPQKPIDLYLPFTNYQFLSTKSCSKITCLQSLQFFGQDNSMQNSQDIKFVLNQTNSELEHHVKQYKKIPSIVESWKVFVNVPHAYQLPNLNSFEYPNNDIISKLIITQLASVLITLGTFIVSFISTQKLLEYKDVSCTQIVFGIVSVLFLYLAQNFVQLKIIQMILLGLSKGMFVSFIIHNVPSFSHYTSFSVFSMIIILTLSIYEIYYPTMFTGLFLTSVAVILLIKSAAQPDAWSKQIFVGVLSLGCFAFSELILTLDDYYIWRVIRIYSMGLGISLLHSMKINQGQLNPIQNPGKFYEGAEQGSIVELDESTL